MLLVHWGLSLLIRRSVARLSGWKARDERSWCTQANVTVEEGSSLGGFRANPTRPTSIAPWTLISAFMSPAVERGGRLSLHSRAVVSAAPAPH